MNNLTIIQLVSIVIITCWNMKYIYNEIILDSLKTNELIKDVKNKYINGLLLILNVVLVMFSVYVYIINEVHLTDYLGPILMGAVLFFIYMFTVMFAVSCAIDLKFLLEYFMISEYSKDIPTSLIEFKLDTLKLVESNPDYLISYDLDFVDDDDDDDDEYEEDYIGSIEEEDAYIFPLYKELLVLTDSIFENKLSSMINSPILNSYLIENIALLSTIMTILKDEKLVKALNSDLGAPELEDLTERFKTLNNNLDKGVKYIKDEKERFEKASETTVIIDSLNEVRSMKEMLDSLK